MNSVERNSIEIALKDILTRVHGKKVEDDNLNIPFLSGKWKMTPIDLVDLLFDIEEKFGIHIPANHIEDGKFGTFTGIVDIIYEVLNESKTKVV